MALAGVQPEPAPFRRRCAGIANSRRGTAADEPTSTTSAPRRSATARGGHNNRTEQPVPNTLGEKHGRKNRQDHGPVPVHGRDSRTDEQRLVAEPTGYPGSPPQLESVRSDGRS